MNHMMLAGNLGGDPETRFTSDGKKITTLRLASNTRRGGKEITVWYRLTIWGDQFDGMVKYLKKGSSLIVFGELHPPEIYNEKVSLELTVREMRFSPFGRAQDSATAPGPQPMQQPAAPTPQMAASAAPTYGSAPAAMPTPEDEIPF